MYNQFQISNNMALFIDDLKKTAVEIHVECLCILKYRNIINSFFHNTGIFFILLTHTLTLSNTQVSSFEESAAAKSSCSEG